MPVRTLLSYKDGRDTVCHGAFPLALGCTIKRARQLSRELTDYVQVGVIIWTRYFFDCYGTLGCPVRLNCNASLLNIDEDNWRASWGMLPCWVNPSPFWLKRMLLVTAGYWFASVILRCIMSWKQRRDNRTWHENSDETTSAQWQSTRARTRSVPSTAEAAMWNVVRRCGGAYTWPKSDIDMLGVLSSLENDTVVQAFTSCMRALGRMLLPHADVSPIATMECARTAVQHLCVILVHLAVTPSTHNKTHMYNRNRWLLWTTQHTRTTTLIHVACWALLSGMALEQKRVCTCGAPVSSGQVQRAVLDDIDDSLINHLISQRDSAAARVRETTNAWHDASWMGFHVAQGYLSNAIMSLVDHSPPTPSTS